MRPRLRRRSVEKKPLNHFFPGAAILSFGTAACNRGCKFCQNWNLSKAKIDAGPLRPATQPTSSRSRSGMAGADRLRVQQSGHLGRLRVDVARAARARGVKNVLVTAGYVTEKARGESCTPTPTPRTSTSDVHRGLLLAVNGRALDAVLETLRWIHDHTATWLEVTTLLIPGHNDGGDEIRRLADWFRANLGPDVPLHFTAFDPDFKMLDVAPTPPRPPRRTRAIAKAAGLRYAYTGDVPDEEGQTTTCARFAKPPIGRNWYAPTPYELRVDDAGAACAHCGQPLPGRFSRAPVAPSAGFRRLRVAAP